MSAVVKDIARERAWHERMASSNEARDRLLMYCISQEWLQHRRIVERLIGEGEGPQGILPAPMVASMSDVARNVVSAFSSFASAAAPVLQDLVRQVNKSGHHLAKVDRVFEWEG